MSAIAPVIQLAGLTKAYNVGTPVETEVLHGIDFALAEGEFAALIPARRAARMDPVQAIRS